MRENITFVNRENTKISGVLHSKDTRPILAYAIFAHCFTCSKNINSAVNIAEELAEQGIATLRFDFTGLGSSGGDFVKTNFSSNVQDIIDAAEFLKSEYQAPELLVGHSLGGTAILAAAAHIVSAKARCHIRITSNTRTCATSSARQKCMRLKNMAKQKFC